MKRPSINYLHTRSLHVCRSLMNCSCSHMTTYYSKYEAHLMRIHWGVVETISSDNSISDSPFPVTLSPCQGGKPSWVYSTDPIHAPYCYERVGRQSLNVLLYLVVASLRIIQSQMILPSIRALPQLLHHLSLVAAVIWALRNFTQLKKSADI